MTAQAVKILIVDDLPEKILVYQSILEDSDLEIVAVRSGEEALKLLLKDEFAVILLDVNMPGMDGFETASLIRARKRCAHMPIIFVTSHSDEMHAQRGYSYGAVDYILTPVVPDVLRTKVGVFVELFRKAQQIRQQAETLRELEAREHRRQLRESHERLDLALEAGNMVACEWDGGDRLLSWSPALCAVFGLAPDSFDGSAEALRQRVHPNDRDRVEAALRSVFVTGGEIRLEHRIIRPSGALAWLELRGRVFAGEGAPPRLVGVCMDITERRMAEAARFRLAAIVESTDDAVLGKTLDGIVTSMNPAAERLFGYTSAEIVGRPVLLLVPPDRVEEERELLQGIARGERRHFETVRLSRDGRRIDIALTVSPVLGSDGRIVGGSTIARDIGDRKRAEAELHRHREHLEQLVRERTAELQATHQRLRMADRLASIGTLAAGLGHDMGNLLLPVRVRLEALDRVDLPPQAREDVNAIAGACEYLKRLSQGLRLFALNPEELAGSGEHTDLAGWWDEVSPFLRSVVSRAIALHHQFGPDLPPVAMPPHVLTQAVYNLLQNASDAIEGRSNGRISILAGPGSVPDTVEIVVSDNGSGMDEETRRRCIEPFFTTKTRAISTGFGLSLVCGCVHRAGGTLDIESALGVGTTFRIRIPAAQLPSHDLAPPVPRSSACVDLQDARTAAYVTTVLESLGVRVVHEPCHPQSPARLAVTAAEGGRAAVVHEFLRRDRARTAILLGPGGPSDDDDRILRLPLSPPAADLRAAIVSAVRTGAETTG